MAACAETIENDENDESDAASTLYVSFADFEVCEVELLAEKTVVVVAPRLLSNKGGPGRDEKLCAWIADAHEAAATTLQSVARRQAIRHAQAKVMPLLLAVAPPA